jgi:hypothetical protein
LNSPTSVVYADSTVAIEQGWQEASDTATIFRSLSPALILDKRNCVTSAEDLWRDNGAEKLAEDSLTFCQQIYDALKTDDRYARMSLAIAQLGILFPTSVRVAMSVRPEDYSNPVTVIQTKSGNEAADRVQNIPWHDILCENSQLHVVDIDISERIDIERHRSESIGFLDRQRLGGWEKIGFQLIQKFWNKVPFASPRGTFFLLRENPLLRETALHLAYRAFSLKSLTPAPAKEDELSKYWIAGLREHIQDPLNVFLSSRLPGPAVKRLSTMFMGQVESAASRYSAGERYWIGELDKRAKDNPKAILTNMLMTPETAALHQVCLDRDLPVIAFQHGVSREINRHNTYIQAYFEGNSADKFYTFNQSAADISDKCYFNKSENVAVGFPTLYLRTGSYRKSAYARQPILYASTQLFNAALNMAAARGCTDTEMAVSELRLVDEVLSQLPHEILYKPYPERRFLDPDPVLEKVDKVENISIYEKGDDLRYLMANSKVVVTSRASSTLGWCVASQKPLVFINYPRQLPLWPKAKEALQKAIFVFDASEDDYLDKLNQFLSQPIADIEEQWSQKAAVRKNVVNELFGCDGWGAGQRAAADITRFIANK